MYQPSPTSADSCVRQGEIISDVSYVRLAPESVGDEPAVLVTKHPFSIVLTQDCDLDQDFRCRLKGELASDKVLPCVLLCEVATAEELFGKLGGRKKEWEREKIDKNKNERYHFLQRIASEFDARGVGIDELGIDFKRYFTVPADELYKRIGMGEAARRSVLVSPYLEHFSSRFAYFMSRVGLPEDHLSE